MANQARFQPLTEERIEFLRERFNLSDSKIQELRELSGQFEGSESVSPPKSDKADLRRFFEKMHARHRPLTNAEWRTLNEPINF
jgi:hypothetical protein